MPVKIKSNKITFSDVETPQEKDKNPERRAKIASAQCFSDLHPIVEETTKHPNEDSTKSTEELVFECEKPINSINDSSSKTNLKHMSDRKHKFYKASSQIYDLEQFSASKIAQNSAGNDESDDSCKLEERSASSSNVQTSVANITEQPKPEKSINELINNANQPNRIKVNSDRIAIQNKEIQQRENIGNENKSARRNRNERMKSAHSNQRAQNQDQNSQNVQPNKKSSKVFTMKNATSRVLPKVAGAKPEL